MSKKAGSWMQDLHQYHLLMWSKEIDKFNKEERIQLNKEQLELYSSQIIEYNKKVGREMHCEVPVVCSEQTNWVARKMIPLLKYLQIRNPKQPDFARQVRYEVENDYDF